MSENSILFLANFEKPLSSKTEQMDASDSVLKPKVLFMFFVCLSGCGCVCVWRPVLSVLFEIGSLIEPETCWPASLRDLPVLTSPSLSVSGIGLDLRWVLGVKLRSWCLASQCFTTYLPRPSRICLIDLFLITGFSLAIILLEVSTQTYEGSVFKNEKGFGSLQIIHLKTAESLIMI